METEMEFGDTRREMSTIDKWMKEELPRPNGESMCFLGTRFLGLSLIGRDLCSLIPDLAIFSIVQNMFLH
jgi:hypothetical protein